MTNKISGLCLLSILFLGGCVKDVSEVPDTGGGASADNPPAVVQPQSYFIVNEDWYGVQNGSVNRIWSNGNVTYRAYRKANLGAELGTTTQFGTIYGNNIYFVSKQGARFVVADAATLQKKASFEYIGDRTGGDGRSCTGVDVETIYVGTSAGIHLFDIPTLSFTGKVSGAEGSSDPYGEQVGDMLRIGRRVFAVMQGKGVLVIDAATHRVQTTIGANTTGGLCQSRDGLLWVAGNPLEAYDPCTLERKRSVTLPDGNGGGGAGWGSWRSCSLCAGRLRNAVYWLAGDGSSFGGKSEVFMYNIDDDHLTRVMEIETYGVIRIDPLTGHIVTADGTMYDDNGKLRRKVEILGGSPVTGGAIDESKPYPYWFATLPLFEDANRPAILTRSITIPAGGETKICLSDMVVDHDNISKSIRKHITAHTDPLVKIEIKSDTLYLKASDSKGSTFFTFEAESNGFSTEKQIAVEVK